MPKWQQQKNVEEIILVLEKREKAEYRRVVDQYKNVSIVTLPDNNRGINYSRNYIVLMANGMGLDRIIMSDDDLCPRPDSDVDRLFEWNGLNTLGIGMMFPLYGLMFGNNTIKNEDRPLMSKGALGKGLYSINVRRALAIGNFDVRFHSGWGDDEFVRQGMAALQATWYVHAGVNGVFMAGRYTPGGINDYHNEDRESRLKGQELSHRLIYKKWGPRYISDPSKRMLCRWKLFLNDFVPDWQSRIDWVKK